MEVHGLVRLCVVLALLLVFVHLFWEISSQSIILDQRQDFLRFESDLYRSKEHRASRLANLNVSRVSLAPIDAMHDMNSYASKQQSINMPSNSMPNEISRKDNEAGIFMGKNRKSNNFHDTMYMEQQQSWYKTKNSEDNSILHPQHYRATSEQKRRKVLQVPVQQPADSAARMAFCSCSDSFEPEKFACTFRVALRQDAEISISQKKSKWLGCPPCVSLRTTSTSTRQCSVDAVVVAQFRNRIMVGYPSPASSPL